MAEMVDCCGCCLLCCACASVCGRLCLWIPWPGRRQKAKDIEDDEEYMRRVEMDNFVAPAPANYVQPTLKQGPIVNPDRRSHGSPNDGRRSNVTNGSHAQKPSVNGFPDTQEPLPQRMSERRSQEPSHEYPPQPSRESQSARGGDRHTREPSSTANVYPSQQPVASPHQSDAAGSQH